MRVIPTLTAGRRRPEAVAGQFAAACVDVGERGALSLLAEAAADLVEAADCFISVIEPGGERGRDHAGFTRSPERWRVHADEYLLKDYPATAAVVRGAGPAMHALGSPGCDVAEAAYMRALGLTAELMLRFDVCDRSFLLEAWRDGAGDRFELRDAERAERLLKLAAPAVRRAMALDAEHERRFGAAVREAEELGVADRALPGLAVAVGEAMGLEEQQLRDIRLVALVHDIGTRPVPAAMMAKSEPLTPVEWAVVQAGTVVGERMLRRMPFLAEAVVGAGALQERWDGGGYPRRLVGDAIPLAARVVSVCAEYRSLLAGGPRQQALDHDEAVGQVVLAAGVRFDPDVVRVACDVLRPDGAVPVVRLRHTAI